MSNGYYTDVEDVVYTSPSEVVDYLIPDSQLMVYERNAVETMVEGLWGDSALLLAMGLTWHESRCWTDGTKVWSTDYELKACLWRRLMDRDELMCGAIKEWMVRSNMTVLDALFTNAVAVFEEWFEVAVNDDSFMRGWLGIGMCGPGNIEGETKEV